MPRPVVVSATPIRSRAWMVRRHAKALCCQTRPLDAILYVTGDNEDETEELLAAKLGVTVIRFDTGSPHWTRDREGERYTGDQHESLAQVYNRCLEAALAVEPKATHIWLLDSDVVPDRHVLELLLAADKDLVAAVVWNSPGALNFMGGWTPPINHPAISPGYIDPETGVRAQPGVGEPKRLGIGEEDVLLAQGPIACTFLSACTLIRREVLEKCRQEVEGDVWNAGDCEPYVRFAPDPRSHDFPFCASARSAGYSLWLEPRARTSHYFHGPDKEPLR